MKAEFFEDKNISDQILNSKSAIECKQLSREIQNYDQHTWLPAAKSICEQGIANKFFQNNTLAKDLLSTGDKTLVECGYDDHWGTGVPPSDKNCLDHERWCNQGILGEILMEIRTELHSSSVSDAQSLPLETNQDRLTPSSTASVSARVNGNGNHINHDMAVQEWLTCTPCRAADRLLTSPVKSVPTPNSASDQQRSPMETTTSDNT